MNSLKKLFYSFCSVCFIPQSIFAISTNIDNSINLSISVNDFYPMIISSSLFIGTLITTLILKKIFDVNFFVKKIKFLKISRETFIFGIIYFLWWIGFLISSFFETTPHDILTYQGKWIVLNLSTALLPNLRNCCWIYYFRIPHYHILEIHRFSGFLSFVAILIKLITFLYLYFLPSSTLGLNIMGIVATFLVFLTVCVTHNKIKEKHYELFYYSHKILASGTIIASTVHSIKTLIYIAPAILFYCFDLILRRIHTYRAIYSHLKIAGEEKFDTSCIFIHMTLLHDIKVDYGTYFFIKFDDISSIEYHPLSLISKHNENLIFCAKDRGKNTWTNKLKRFDSSKETNILMNKSMYIQGPYKHVYAPFDSNKYKTLYFIAGGIGITTIISLLQEVNELNSSSIEKVRLFWVMKHFSAAKPFIHLLSTLDERFYINIYLSNDVYTNDISDRIKCYNYKINVRQKLLQYFMKDYITDKSKLCVTTCGPKTLIDDVSEFCDNLDIELYKEIF